MQESSPSSGDSQEGEADKIERNTKKAKRFWSARDNNEEGRISRSFSEVVTKGMDKNQEPWIEEEKEDAEMKEGEEGHFKEGFIEESSDWETDSENGDISQDEDLCPTIVLSRKEKMRLRQPWISSVIIKLVGMNMGFVALSRRLNALWKPSGALDIIDIGNEFYIARFGAAMDYRKVLTEGPWIISDHYLSVQRWKPDFDPERAELNSLVVWVRFPEVPIEYFDREFLFSLGKRIGKVLKVDITTELATRGKYARVCVEVDLNKPLLSKYRRRGKVYRILYESLHMLCYKCGKYGHVKENCPLKQDEVATEGEREEENVPNKKIQEDEPIYGPWMVVQKPRFRRNNQRPTEMKGNPLKPVGNRQQGYVADNKKVEGNFGESSRFTALQNDTSGNEMIQERNDGQADKEVTLQGSGSTSGLGLNDRNAKTVREKENVNPNVAETCVIQKGKVQATRKEGKQKKGLISKVDLDMTHPKKATPYKLPEPLEKAKSSIPTAMQNPRVAHDINHFPEGTTNEVNSPMQEEAGDVICLSPEIPKPPDPHDPRKNLQTLPIEKDGDGEPPDSSSMPADMDEQIMEECDSVENTAEEAMGMDLEQ